MRVTRQRDTVQIVQHGPCYRLTRGSNVYAVRVDGDALRGEWVPLAAIPNGSTADLSEEAARIALPLLRSLGRLGRNALPAESSDGKLVDRACRVLGVNRTGLAARLGTGPAVLSRAREGELPPAHRETLLRWIREARDGNDAPSKK
jgi:hypothetical protein